MREDDHAAGQGPGCGAHIDGADLRIQNIHGQLLFVRRQPKIPIGGRQA
jgi:hypothetical protein